MTLKSILISYLFWLIGGLIGLHLLYLRRDKQAFLYWCTFGGFFGFGPLRDLFRIPSYVREANYDEEFASEFSDIIRKNEKPPYNFTRMFAASAVGSYFGALFTLAVPSEPVSGISFTPLLCLAPLAAAIGIWMVYDIGLQKGSFLCALIGVYLLHPVSWIYSIDLDDYKCFFCTFVIEWKGKSWRRSPPARVPLCKRIATLSMGLLILSSVWTSYIYFNGTFNDKDGQTIRIRDAIYYFFKSPMFLEFKERVWEVLRDLRLNGIKSAWNKTLDLIDPSGERLALKVLGLAKGASQEEISAMFKKLSREWHPDKHKDPELKKVAEQKFMEIADAYEKLSFLKKKRNRQNRINREEL